MPVSLLESGADGLRRMDVEESYFLPDPKGFQTERPVNWERPSGLENFPCGASLTVGSFPTRDVDIAMRRYFIGCSEGGIIGAGQFPKLQSKTMALVFKDGKLETAYENHDDMFYQAVCGDNSGIVGIPTLTSVNGEVRVQGVIIHMSDGSLHWLEDEFPGSKQRWNELNRQLEDDYLHVDSGQELERLGKYAFPQDAAPGFYNLLNNIDDIKQYNPWAIKIQLASPATVLKNIKDWAGSHSLENSPEFVSVVTMMIALRNRWMVEKVREKWEGRIILCTDNPCADQMTPEEIGSDANTAFSLVRNKKNLLLYEHSCGGKIDDFSFVKKADLNGFHFDAYGYQAQIVGNFPVLADFLAFDDNRSLALGIVPTKSFRQLAEEVKFGEPLVKDKTYWVEGLKRISQQLEIKEDGEAISIVAGNYEKALKILYRRLEYIVDKLFDSGKFIDKKEIWKKIIVSSSCGQGALDVGVGEMVSYMVRDLSYLVRKWKLDVDYGSGVY